MYPCFSLSLVSSSLFPSPVPIPSFTTLIPFLSSHLNYFCSMHFLLNVFQWHLSQQQKYANKSGFHIVGYYYTQGPLPTPIGGLSVSPTCMLACHPIAPKHSMQCKRAELLSPSLERERRYIVIFYHKHMHLLNLTYHTK